MQNILSWMQIITCVLLILSVLFQDSKTGNQSMYSSNQSYFKPRGKEAFLNNLTKICGFALFAISVASLIIK